MSTQPDLSPRSLFINGEWIAAASGNTFDTINPATEETLTTVAKAGKDDVNHAVAAARAAMDEGKWPAMSAADRGRIIWKMGDLLLQRADEVAQLETLDNGKPIFESRYVDIPSAAGVFQYYAGFATKIHGETYPVSPGSFNYTLREPVGVVAAIVPWNFPLLLASWKVAPALAAGCTVVLKPASNTPLTALKLAEIAAEAGLPPGVLNVVTGPGAEVGDALVTHPDVDKVAFTGATHTGIEIMKKASETLKRVTLELGGKSPNIVLADADLDAAVKGATNGIFYGKGEVCAAGSRLLVEDSIHDAFMEKLVERARRMKPADPMHPKTRLGAIVSQAQHKSVMSYVEAGKSEGARLLLGGEPAKVNGKGYFIHPTIFDDVDNGMKIAQEEIFGPVLSTIRFREDEAEAIRLANDNPYGLAAAVWTSDVKKAHRVARALKAGTVWVNAYNMYDAAASFGGYKMSGLGRELGPHGLEAYTQIKSVWVDLT
jgi:acyl-CoA reductase-like NAD-dependent aldehyde dehydrogenase